MTLAAEVQARYGTEYLVSITNPSSETSTTIDSTRLTLACTDAAADFSIEAAATFDLTNPNHVGIAVEGVIGYLLRRLGTQSEEAERRIREFKARLKQLATIDQRDWVTPGMISEEPRMPRSSGQSVTPRRPNRGRTGVADNQIETS